MLVRIHRRGTENGEAREGYSSAVDRFPSGLWKQPNNKRRYAPGLEQDQLPPNLEPGGRAGDASERRPDLGDGGSCLQRS